MCNAYSTPCAFRHHSVPSQEMFHSNCLCFLLSLLQGCAWACNFYSCLPCVRYIMRCVYGLTQHPRLSQAAMAPGILGATQQLGSHTQTHLRPADTTLQAADKATKLEHTHTHTRGAAPRLCGCLQLCCLAVPADPCSRGIHLIFCQPNQNKLIRIYQWHHQTYCNKKPFSLSARHQAICYSCASFHTTTALLALSALP
jgi:hypothetical protein